MQEKLTNSQTPTSSRASSFFIENLLGKGRNGQESISARSRGEAAVETVSTGRVLNAHHADTGAPAPDGSSSTARSPYRDLPLQWYHGGTALNFRAVETPQSEYRVTFMRPGNKSLFPDAQTTSSNKLNCGHLSRSNIIHKSRQFAAAIAGTVSRAVTD